MLCCSLLEQPTAEQHTMLKWLINYQFPNNYCLEDVTMKWEELLKKLKRGGK